MKPLTLAPCVALALVMLANAGLAGEGHGQGHGGHGAHVHGLGRLDLAQEGPEVHLRLETPAASILGFEHRPRGEAERAAQAEALAALRDGQALFEFSEAAGCTLEEVVVESTLVEPGEDDRADHHPGQDEEGDTHADIEVAYRFLCARPGALKEVRVTLFDRFPSLERLEVQLATERGQAGAELTPTSPLLRP